jgi:hypothetical protein
LLLLLLLLLCLHPAAMRHRSAANSFPAPLGCWLAIRLCHALLLLLLLLHSIP